MQRRYLGKSGSDNPGVIVLSGTSIPRYQAEKRGRWFRQAACCEIASDGGEQYEFHSPVVLHRDMSKLWEPVPFHTALAALVTTICRGIIDLIDGHETLGV